MTRRIFKRSRRYASGMTGYGRTFEAPRGFSSAAARGLRERRVLVPAIVAAALLAGGLGFLIGRESRDEISDVRRSATAEGLIDGAKKGTERGYPAGLKDGRRRGYRQEYRKAYKAAFERGVEKGRRSAAAAGTTGGTGSGGTQGGGTQGGTQQGGQQPPGTGQAPDSGQGSAPGG